MYRKEISATRCCNKVNCFLKNCRRRMHLKLKAHAFQHTEDMQNLPLSLNQGAEGTFVLLQAV